MPRIEFVYARNDHTLEIGLDNSHCIIFNMKPRLEAVRFGVLSDLELFKKVRLEHGNTLVWNSFCQITLDEIMSLIER